MGDLVYVLLDLFTAAAYLQKILQFVHAHISLLVFIDLWPDGNLIPGWILRAGWVLKLVQKLEQWQPVS